MSDAEGLREGVRRIPRRRKETAAPRVKTEVDEEGVDENSPLNQAEERVGEEKEKEAPNKERDIEAGVKEKEKEVRREDKKDDFRADPAKEFLVQQKRLERASAEGLPEVHCVGQIKSCNGVIQEESEGACLRWRIEHDKAWEHLGGELIGQTQVAYCKYMTSDSLALNHPLDLHFAEAGLHGWGAPRISIQAFRMDKYGRRVLAGYGFLHLPLHPGLHVLDVPLWRPSGSPEQEMEAFFLGNTPALVTSEPIYETAWRDRCRLVTTAAGRVVIELFICTRNTRKHGVDI